MSRKYKNKNTKQCDVERGADGVLPSPKSVVAAMSDGKRRMGKAVSYSEVSPRMLSPDERAALLDLVMSAMSQLTAIRTMLTR